MIGPFPLKKVNFYRFYPILRLIIGVVSVFFQKKNLHKTLSQERWKDIFPVYNSLHHQDNLTMRGIFPVYNSLHHQDNLTMRGIFPVYQKKMFCKKL